MFREEQTVSLLFLKDRKTGLPTDTLINILPLVLYSLGTANIPEKRKKITLTCKLVSSKPRCPGIPHHSESESEKHLTSESF